MEWKPCELDGWALAGYGVDKVDLWAEGVDYFMAMNEQTLGRLERAGIECDRESWSRLLKEVEGLEVREMELDSWSIHQLFKLFPDTRSIFETIEDPELGSSCLGIAVYARGGTQERFLQLLEDISIRFRAWADEALGDEREEKEAFVRAALASQWGVDPEEITFWPDQLPQYDGASSVEVCASDLGYGVGESDE